MEGRVSPGLFYCWPDATAVCDGPNPIFSGSSPGRGALACSIPFFETQDKSGSTPGKETTVQVLVRDNNVDQALRVLKKKMQREGLFREMKARSAFEKPSEKRVREKAEAIRRQRKLARKKMQREGLLPAPKKAAVRGAR
jgi:small subunit ribosomal protein S21